MQAALALSMLSPVLDAEPGFKARFRAALSSEAFSFCPMGEWSDGRQANSREKRANFPNSPLNASYVESDEERISFSSNKRGLP